MIFFILFFIAQPLPNLSFGFCHWAWSSNEGTFLELCLSPGVTSGILCWPCASCPAALHWPAVASAPPLPEHCYPLLPFHVSLLPFLFFLSALNRSVWTDQETHTLHFIWNCSLLHSRVAPHVIFLSMAELSADLFMMFLLDTRHSKGLHGSRLLGGKNTYMALLPWVSWEAISSFQHAVVSLSHTQTCSHAGDTLGRINRVGLGCVCYHDCWPNHHFNAPGFYRRFDVLAAGIQYSPPPLLLEPKHTTTQHPSPPRPLPACQGELISGWLLCLHSKAVNYSSLMIRMKIYDETGPRERAIFLNRPLPPFTLRFSWAFFKRKCQQHQQQRRRTDSYIFMI